LAHWAIEINGNRRFYPKKGVFKMKKLFMVLVMMCFVLSVSGLSFAQVPSATAVEKAIDNPTLKGGDTQSAAKPDANKTKAKKNKADNKAAQDKVSKEKASAEKAAIEKAAEEKAKAALPKM
jgi:hypothetical protein